MDCDNRSGQFRTPIHSIEPKRLRLSLGATPPQVHRRFTAVSYLRAGQSNTTGVLPKQRAVGSIPIARSRYENSLSEPSGRRAFPAVRGLPPIWRSLRTAISD